MLLTITYKGSDTPNLGYLLHKKPYRAQSFDMSFGNPEDANSLKYVPDGFLNETQKVAKNAALEKETGKIA